MELIAHTTFMKLPGTWQKKKKVVSVVLCYIEGMKKYPVMELHYIRYIAAVQTMASV
jgi:hypothetical protein